MRYVDLAVRSLLYAIALAGFVVCIFVAVKWRRSFSAPIPPLHRGEWNWRSATALTTHTLFAQVVNGRLYASYSVTTVPMSPPNDPSSRQLIALARDQRRFFVDDRWWPTVTEPLRPAPKTQVAAASFTGARMTHWHGVTLLGEEMDEPMMHLWHRGLRTPIWPILALAAVAPILAMWRLGLRWRRQRRLRMTGHCPACGYDLRATPQRCPECGRDVPVT
jgi:hypothetical protein